MTIHPLRLNEQLFLPRKSDNSGGDDLFFDLHLNLCRKSDLSGSNDLFFGLHSNLGPKIMVFLASSPISVFATRALVVAVVSTLCFSRVIVVACMQACSWISFNYEFSKLTFRYLRYLIIVIVEILQTGRDLLEGATLVEWLTIYSKL